jgi:hypothetical protein
MSLQLEQKPLITIKEARKLLGSLADSSSDEELMQLIETQTQLVRLALSDFMVRKISMVSS